MMMKPAKHLEPVFLIFVFILFNTACIHRQSMNKSKAEKALKVFDSELIGTLAGLSQTDGWEALSALLKSDSITNAGDRISSDSLPVAFPGTNNIITSVFLKIPLNFRQEFFKNGKTVCTVNSYFRSNPDSSFYIRRLIYINPCSFEIKCFCIPDKGSHTLRMTLLVTGRDTAGFFLYGRMMVSFVTRQKKSFHTNTLQAGITLFELKFSMDADFSQMKPGSQETWGDLIRLENIKVRDKTSGQYIGRFEWPEKDNLKNDDLLFVFADGSKEPASACFSFYSMLSSKD
ncbi:MAG: hypothetical protein NTU51_09520 [Bacteroidetes bacterium]|nr:hypothetical protein [Bacteroidota bacterium]